jgi:hypothetical protein
MYGRIGMIHDELLNEQLNGCGFFFICVPHGYYVLSLSALVEVSNFTIGVVNTEAELLGGFTLVLQVWNEYFYNVD